MGFEKDPPLEADRKKCWDARDALWQCLDSNNEEEAKCKAQRKLFEESCSKQWVKHFDRKYKYEKYKVQFFKDGAKSPEGQKRLKDHLDSFQEEKK